MNDQIVYAQALLLLWGIVFVITIACIAISTWRARRYVRLTQAEKEKAE
jgi:hypothetical protein